MPRSSPTLALLLTLVAAVSLGACQACRTQPAETPLDEGAAAKPTIRLYLVSTVAGALEPCGCTKDQLGGIDHVAAYVASEAQAARGSLVLGAGPLLFADPTLKGDEATQGLWKAETIAQASKDIGLAGWAPGYNDWAAGAAALAKLAGEAGATILAGNLTGAPATTSAIVREVGGVKVGIVGVADPRDKAGRLPEGVQASQPVDAMRAGLADAKAKGARVFVGLAAMPRGQALRLADALPELHVLAVGKPVEIGDLNDAQGSPELVGNTLVVETANHLQTVAVVDLTVRGDGDAPLQFADAGGLAKSDELLRLGGRIRDLEHRINAWDKDKLVKAEDLAARKADLDRLRAEKAKLEAAPVAEIAKGSTFRYAAVEVRDKFGAAPAVVDRMRAYYKRVNEHNKVAFADRVAPKPDAGQAGYIGVEECTTCHDDERKVWDKTAHAHAYPTLEKDFKEFNLDCVSCHVTGYDKPGGSTVTAVAKLKNVQCEECHGPGSLHAKAPEKKGLIVLKPDPASCVSQCHHPPHVEGFDPVEKMKLVLGPGHGQD